MATKRQNGNPPEPVTTAKKTKTQESEFNGSVFKSMLKDSSRALKGLETFIRIAKKLPCPDLYDVVEGYIKISVECSEIFALLEEENKSESELALIFQSLEMILLRTASDLSQLSMVGSNIVRKTVSSHMKLLLSSLYSENHGFVRQCLCLLSALVSQGAEAARDVFSQMQFSKGLSSLAQRKDKSGKPNVRMAYIQFVLSFLMSGDNTTIGQILDTKDFLSEILTSGLTEDRLSIVNLILSTLQTRVVQNKTITKTQKVRFFSPSILRQISSLYKWNGIVDVRMDENENDEEAGKRIVRELVHNFLLDICCSRKNGISFHDPSLGTAGRAGNIVLLQFLVRLKQATEDEMVADLVVSVLKASPDILTRYFKETQFSFSPRIAKAWQDNISLLKKIYEAQPEVSKAFQTSEMIPLPRLLSMVLVTSLPSVCNKVFFTQGLNLPNVVVQHTTLSLLAFILKRAQKNIEHCLDRTAWESSDIYSPAVMEEFVQLYREALSKILPDMVCVISNWQSLSKEKEDVAKTKNTEQNKSKEHLRQDDPQVILVKALLLQVMCLYQRVVPHLVSQSKFDFSKLLKGVVTEKGMKQEIPPVLQYQILQLALELPASKFSWFRVQELADPDLEKGEKSVFYLLLKMFVSTNSSYLKTSTRMLVLKVLRDSGVFEHTWKELELWLDHLARLDPSQQETVIQFLDHVLMRVVCNPHVYTEKAASAVQEAAFLQANLSGQEGDEASIPISHIDDVLDMVDVIVEGSEGDVEEIGPSLTQDIILQTFPFSAIVPAVLEARNKLPESFKDGKGVVVYEYMAAVLCDVLHSQRDPLALCLTLQLYDEELNTSDASSPPHASVVTFYHYYSQWLPKNTQKTLSTTEDFTDGRSYVGFTALLKASHSEGANAFLQDSFKEAAQEAMTALDVSQFPVAVNQVLFYIRNVVVTFNSLPKETAGEVLGRLMALLNSLILKLLSSETQQPSQPEPAEQQDEGDLFFDTDHVPAQNIDKEQIILAVLRSVFKHPAVEQWFLALELSSFPPHSLNPVRLKQLCGHLTESTLTLLESSAATLRELDALELVSTYLTAAQRAVLRELQDKRSKSCPKKQSLCVRALLSLHEYIEPSSLKEVVSALLLLPQKCLVAPENQLSVYGHAVLKLLSEDHSSCIALSQAHLRGLAALLTSCQCVQLEDFLLQVLSREPGTAKLIQTDVLLHCIQRESPSAQAIGVVLLQNCSTHILSFELWCLEPSNLAQISSQSSSFLFLLNAYLKRAIIDDPTCPKDIQKSVLKALKKALLSELWHTVQQGEVGVMTSLHVEVLSGLIRLAAGNADLTQLMKDLPAILQKPDGYERWTLADGICEKLSDSSEELSQWRKSLLSAALCWLAAVYKEQKDPQSHHEETMLTRLKSLLIFPENISASDWNTFVKSGLKYRYSDSSFLGTLNTLVEIIYATPETPKELLSMSTIHMMTTSHSLFLPTMLGTQNESDSLHPSKESLVSFLLTLVKKCPEVCNSNHFLVLLGAYGASLSTTDQKLLLVLQEYEKNNISLTEFQYVLWGPAAVEHHKARKSLGPSLWQKPSSEQLLSLLSADKMLNTVMHFPHQRNIILQGCKNLVYTQEGNHSVDLSSLYDPCFLLPLFSFILHPECAVDCQKFVSSHALGVTVAALSSSDPKVRAAAYQVLGSFYQHLEGARFREKRQLLYLLDTVKNGIQKQNLQVPFVHVTYIAKVAQQILRPEEHMYMVVSRFLLGTQFLDLKRVPDFFKLFYSFDLEHKMEREWGLSILEEGVRDKLCYELCEKQGIYQTLLGFCSTSLSDQASQIQIINVLRQTAHCNRAAYVLTKEHGVLTWILQMIEKRNVDSTLLSALIELLHALWFTNLGKKERKPEANGSTSELPQASGKCLPLPIINEFLCTLITVIRHLGSGVSAPQLKAVLHTLYSVLLHRGTTLNAHQEAGWLTLHPQKLSCSEVLGLLQRWATLARDASLLSALQTLINKHKVREMMGSGREKGQGKCHSAKHTQFRMEKQTETVDGQGEKLEQALLDECKPLLRNILIHWEPIDRPDSSSVDVATACLILKWALKTLTESPYDDSSTLAVLKWVNCVILPHTAMVDAVLSDEDTRKDFLRLYHHTAQEHPSTVDTLQLFSRVMVHLLEARGGFSNDTHQTVLRTCLPANTDDGAKQESGLKLLSLYIYELWSGAQSPDLLLTHARLLCNRTDIKKPKSHTLQMCKDILSALDS
ncbi:LOW QUALITY PROTEIN: nucleolar pre-ribosomal-associated protein 1 [Megalobrama amblycephala]|uniref:LOW QUALITY PROTEIN: nucleolar pre-ribosomal-associated protein 1 n=1 Tax=Megalobrama amblycephala TaxID=75352 RepID=UPI0020140C25|nr:LOW QUALITY PROTEIN: nucleolar pre-ribosomal-associated protein 1 [Megalobrama amblycephala]